MNRFFLLISSIFLFLALFDGLPYGFFVLLRFVTTVSFLYMAFIFFSSKKQSLVFIFAGLAILFNPIFPFHLGRDVWIMVDLIVGIFSLAVLLLLKSK